MLLSHEQEALIAKWKAVSASLVKGSVKDKRQQSLEDWWNAQVRNGAAANNPNFIPVTSTGLRMSRLIPCVGKDLVFYSEGTGSRLQMV